jgi:glutaredoxin
VNLELITRRGCHHCEALERRLQEGGVEVTLRDIDTDPELLRLYDFRVPVLLRDGKVIAEGIIDPAALDRALHA